MCFLLLNFLIEIVLDNVDNGVIQHCLQMKAILVTILMGMQLFGVSAASEMGCCLPGLQGSPTRLNGLM